MSEAAKALSDKLETCFSRSTLWTGYGYLYIIRENELDAERLALRKELYPELYQEVEAEPAAEAEPVPAEST